MRGFAPAAGRRLACFVRPLGFGARTVKLEDAIFLVGQMPEGATICAKKPFLRGAEAVITQLTSEYAVPQ